MINSADDFKVRNCSQDCRVLLDYKLLAKVIKFKSYLSEFTLELLFLVHLKCHVYISTFNTKMTMLIQTRPFYVTN
jgi:hypothetical protein